MPGSHISRRWRIRFIVGTIAVAQETLAGRPTFACIIAVFIGPTYLTPACQHASELHLNAVASAGGQGPEPVSRAGYPNPHADRRIEDED